MWRVWPGRYVNIITQTVGNYLNRPLLDPPGPSWTLLNPEIRLDVDSPLQSPVWERNIISALVQLMVAIKFYLNI